MLKKILITGVSGFIGQNFLEYIKKKNIFKIYAIYNSTKPHKKFKGIYTHPKGVKKYGNVCSHSYNLHNHFMHFKNHLTKKHESPKV